MSRMVFINLPVRDLKASMAFFSRLGFEFDLRFTDENAACMILSDKGHVMLLAEPFFKTFTPRELCDTATHGEVLVAITAESRAEVDSLVDRALENGARHAAESVDHGFMYFRTFYDLDGHHWEVIWMDPSAAPPQN